MCGIAGIVSTKTAELAPSARRMAEALAHRGPDDWGVWSDPRCALSHRRLSIIDLSAAGRNPLANDDGTLWITFNGEIYNFPSLRRELEERGHRFRSRTDTEVIVKAYEEWGAACLARLRGMFAFAIWDTRRRRLFLARDRVGKKPLFYATTGERFLFASELQSLLAEGSVAREINAAALDDYLAWGYVPAPHTAFKNVFKLPPAHSLTLDFASDREDGEAAGFAVKVERYWHLDYQPKREIDEAAAAEALREKLTEAVRLRLVSDVPLGAFLSGGIDSSIIVGLMAELSSQPVKTFSIGFEEAEYNELEHARRIAERWQTEHHECIVKADALAVLPKLVRHFGEPYADSSAIPTFYVAQMTRQSVTVALTGDGGDESFAGYERYLGNRVAERANRVPGFALSAAMLRRALPDCANPKNRLRTAQRFLEAATQPMARRYGSWMSAFDDEAKQRLYSREFRARLNGKRDWLASLFAGTGEANGLDALDPVDAAMRVDVQSYLPFDLLVKVDITSMANSLEARSPFLDHEVMEFAARLPVALKLRGRESKYLLKRAFADLLPAENVRRRKMGFGVPVGEWFRSSLRALLEDALFSEQARRRAYFQPAEVRRLLTEHLERRADHSARLWHLLMLELWHRQVVEAV